MIGTKLYTIGALILLGHLTAFPSPVAAAPSDGPMSGPAAAIAKARAAAAKAQQRAGTTDAELAKTVAAEPIGQPVKSKSEQSGEREQKESDGVTAKVAAADDAATEREPYDPTAHRDPFRPPQLDTAAADARTPLETYQLGQLKLVGVIAQSSEGYRAMVEDSKGLGYIITTGTPIGSSGGVVRSIEPRRVVIEESTRDFYGDVKPKAVVMELPQEDRSP